MMQNTSDDLAAVMQEAADLDVIIVLENHEDFTGPELAEIVEQVSHPNLKILYDYGNSQMVLEDPIAALDAVLPHVYSVHFKDHVMIRAEDAGQLTVAGVPVGDGFLPLTELTRRLLDQGLRRFTFENVWAYSAPIQDGSQGAEWCEPGRRAHLPISIPLLTRRTSYCSNPRSAHKPLSILKAKPCAEGMKAFGRF